MTDSRTGNVRGRLALSLIAVGALGAALAGCGAGGANTTPLATGGDTKAAPDDGIVISGRGVVYGDRQGSGGGKSGDSAEDGPKKDVISGESSNATDGEAAKGTVGGDNSDDSSEDKRDKPPTRGVLVGY